MKSPDISVIVTNHNYGKYIRRCLGSLLNQEVERSRYEIIVVDDHSTDDSLQAIETFKNSGDIRVIVNRRNLGVGGSSHVGVGHSRGKYFVRVDADDYVQPPFLSMLYTFLRFCPQYVGVSCDYYLTDNDERILSVESFRENGLACGMMLRTSYLERIGSYDRKKKVFEDQDLFRRIDLCEVGSLGAWTVRTLDDSWSILIVVAFLLAAAVFAVYLAHVRVYDEAEVGSLRSQRSITPLVMTFMYKRRVAEVVLDFCLVSITYTRPTGSSSRKGNS